MEQLPYDEQQHEHQYYLDQHVRALQKMRDMATWHKQRPFHYRRWILLIFTLGVSAGLCKLALWQWQRAAEKEEWLAHVVTLQQAVPLTLTEIDWRQAERLDGAPLRGKVEWVAPYIWLLDNQLVAHEAGYDVLIPVRADSHSLPLLVNLGWLPAPAQRQQLPLPVIPARFELNGLLRIKPGGVLLGQNIEAGPYPNRLQAIRVDSLNRISGLSLVDAVFYQQTSPFIYHYQQHVMPPEKHRAYAVQWLGLALVALCGGWVLSRRSDG